MIPAKRALDESSSVEDLESDTAHTNKSSRGTCHRAGAVAIDAGSTSQLEWDEYDVSDVGLPSKPPAFGGILRVHAVDLHIFPSLPQSSVGFVDGYQQRDFADTHSSRLDESHTCTFLAQCANCAHLRAD